MQAIETPRYEDFEITHLGPAKKNRWAFLGMGTVPALVEKADASPYLSVQNIDPKWMKAVGIDESKIHEAKVKELQEKNDQLEEQTQENIEKTEVS